MNSKTFSNFFVKSALFAMALLFVFGTASQSLAQTGYGPTVDYQAQVEGGIVVGGNALVTCENTATNCSSIRNGTISGSNADFATNEFQRIDVASTGAASSSYTFNLPAGATVQRAILYHMFYQKVGTPSSGSNGSFGLDLPSTAGYSFTALTNSNYSFSTSRLDVDSLGAPGQDEYFHQNSWNVTALVAGQGAGNASGSYTFRSSRVETVPTSNSRNVAAWHMYIVYTVPGAQNRYIQVSDGLRTFGGSTGSGVTNLSFSLNGLITPPGGAFGSQAGLVVMDGDRDQSDSSEFVKFGTNNGPLTTLDSGNPFNSSLTGTRDPSYVNNMSIDIDQYNVTVGNATSAQFSLNSSNSSEAIYFQLAYIVIDNVVVDAGDAPDSYKTLLASNGPLHGVTTNLLLGATIDGNANGIPGVPANGDDTNSIDDEDGVTSLPLYNPGGGQTCTGSGGATYTTLANEYCVSVDVTNNFGQAATLAGWLDINANGTFDAGERVTLNIPSSGTTTRILVFTGIAPGFNPPYLRLRLSTDANPSPIGSAANGEVEDYALLAPTAVTASVSGRIKDVNGKAVARVNVTLTNILTGEMLTTRTNSFGRYSFENMPSAQTYLLNVSSKRYDFEGNEKVFTLLEDVTDADFTALPTGALIQSIP